MPEPKPPRPEKPSDLDRIVGNVVEVAAKLMVASTASGVPFTNAEAINAALALASAFPNEFKRDK